MNQVFIANPKGGSGKTTISTQLAGYYASKGHRVLLMDHDARNPVLTGLRADRSHYL